MSYKTFLSELSEGKTEEEVKNSFANHFGLKYDNTAGIDLYTNQILFEFKHNKNLDNINSRAAVLAQSLYYVNRLKYGFTDKQIPPIICIADKNEAIFTQTHLWKDFTTDENQKYDWDLAPSMPDENLITDLSKAKELKNIHIYKIPNEKEYELFSEKLTEYFNTDLLLPLSDKKLITEDNFEDVYHYWNDNFGEDVRNGLKSSRYFISDIQKGRTHIDKRENKIVFVFESGEKKIKKILLHNYEYFWSIYEKVSNQDLIRSIYAKLDRLTDEHLRRFQGEFFTPLNFAKKGLDYLEKTLGHKWWNKNYRIWDMAAGTGNLQYHLPSEAYKYTYLSTIHHEDVIHCKKLFPEATVFHYDYLNDDVENMFIDGGFVFESLWKLPQILRDDLANPKLKWVILINPPFATSQTAGTTGKSKKDVSDTKIRKVMHEKDLGEVSRELFAQFLFRIKEEFKEKIAHLGLFSTLKYINANNDQKFRDNVFQFVFERGFVFSSANFSGTKGNNAFPIAFIIWDLSNNKKIEDQKIILDVFDMNVDKIAIKQFVSEHRDAFLSKWIERPVANIIFPPFKSAINITTTHNKDIRNRVADGFIASLMCKGNDFQNQNFTALLSGPYASAGALSITKDNFEKSMLIHAVRRIPKANWLNDRDQFLQPSKKVRQSFINDCTVWNLFSSSNQTVALKDVVYEKKTYQIPNNFFPFRIQELKKWNISDKEIIKSLSSAENRFVANWLHEQNLSREANAVLESGKELYKYYFKHFSELNTGVYKIQTWDAGWWQIRHSLTEQNLGKELIDDLKEKHLILKEKILPEIYEYKFLTLN